MTILVVLISRDANLHELVRSKSSGLLSPDLRHFGSENVELASYHIENLNSIEDAKRYAVRIGKNKSGLIILGEDALAGSLVSLADGYLLASIALENEYRVRLGSLNKVVAKTLKALEAIRTHNNSSKYARIIRLPLTNFDAAEMEQMQTLCANPLAPNFKAELEGLLESIRVRRQTPLRSKRHPRPDFVLVDDRGHRFSFGYEQHSEPDSGNPHTYACQLRKIFRFGDSIEPWRHYNVTSPTTAVKSHDFIDCHGAVTRCSRSSHANAFPGGFVG